MPSLFPDLSSLGFFSRSVLHQRLVPPQPPEPWQKEQTLSSLTHTNLIFQVDPIACPSQLFFSPVSVAAVTPTPCLVRPSHRKQPGWYGKTPFHQQKRARRETQRMHREATNSISHSSPKASHTPPKPSALLTCFPIQGGFFYNQNTTTLPTNVQRTNTTWAYACLV